MPLWPITLSSTLYDLSRPPVLVGRFPYDTPRQRHLRGHTNVADKSRRTVVVEQNINDDDDGTARRIFSPDIDFCTRRSAAFDRLDLLMTLLSAVTCNQHRQMENTAVYRPTVCRHSICLVVPKMSEQILAKCSPELRSKVEALCP